MSLPQRFWDKVELDENCCWIWTGAKSNIGYGEVRWEGKMHRAHRVSYSALVGPIPEGLTIDHLCRVRACVRPDHLEPVTHQENHRRGKWATTTHCPKGHPYNEENTRKRPKGGRDCRTCMREAMKEYRARKKENKNA